MEQLTLLHHNSCLPRRQRNTVTAAGAPGFCSATSSVECSGPPPTHRTSTPPNPAVTWRGGTRRLENHAPWTTRVATARSRERCRDRQQAHCGKLTHTHQPIQIHIKHTTTSKQSLCWSSHPSPLSRLPISLPGKSNGRLRTTRLMTRTS